MQASGLKVCSRSSTAVLLCTTLVSRHSCTVIPAHLKERGLDSLFVSFTSRLSRLGPKHGGVTDRVPAKASSTLLSTHQQFPAINEYSNRQLSSLGAVVSAVGLNR